METPEATGQETTRRRISPAWLAAGAIAVLVLALLANALATRPASAPQIGSQLPDFSLEAFDGSTMSLSEQRGRVTVVNFFSSWCAPCQEEATDLEQTWRSYQGQDVQFFGIAYKDASSKAESFLRRYDVTYPSTSEPGNRTARAFGVTGVPETFVVDPQGRLARHFIGPVTRIQLGQELERLLKP